MNRLQPVGFYLGLMGFFMAALFGGTIFFLFGMSDTTFMLSDGVHVGVQYHDKPKFDSNLQGFIFAISFLMAGGLMCLLVLIPNERRGYLPQFEPLQPKTSGRRRQDQPSASTGEEPAPQPEPQPAVEAEAPQPQEGGTQSMVTIEQTEGEAGEAAPVAANGEESPSTDGQKTEIEKGDDLPELGMDDSDSDETGEDDIVYGNGRVSEDACWDFVQQYPDSAVKFLYRKNLDNKPLGPADEDIYRDWERRGLTRAKIREIVLQIMNWPSLPDSFPHNIWRELRDQIYEIGKS